MNSVRHLVQLLINLMVLCYCSADQSSSELHFIAGLEWGTMTTFLKTNHTVHHLEEDTFVPGNILYSDGPSLMTTDGKTTHLVVSGGFGYAEGRSAQALFWEMTGFIQTHSSHVLAVDWRHHCVRQINRFTNTTSPFVGTCESNGFVNGQYQKARFFYPVTIIRGFKMSLTAIVIDSGNSALRAIELATGVVSTIVTGLPSLASGAAFDPDEENIYITFSTTFGKYNIKNQTYTSLIPISGHQGRDGAFINALVDKPKKIFCTSKVCLIADAAYKKLRVLDMNTEIVSSICSGSSASVDGPTTQCSMKYPESLLLKSNTLFIGEYQAIRSISVKGFFPCEDIDIVICAGEREKCVTSIPGRRMCFPQGVHNYLVKESNCTIKINISQELDGCHMKPCLNSGKCTDRENSTYSCSCSAGWTGRNCEIEVNACLQKPCLNSGICEAGQNDTYTCACRDGWTGSDCQININACTFKPCKNSGNCSTINDSFSCSCTPGWTGAICEREIGQATCPKVIFGTADLKTMKAEISLPSGDSLMLPVGTSVYQQRFRNNILCEIKIIVSDPRLKWRLDFSASYKLPCTILHDFKDLTISLARTRYIQIKQLSSDQCNKSADADILLSCEKDVVHVAWPTDCLFNGNLLTEKEKMMNVIKENFMKKKGFLLELVIPSHIPPLIQPLLNDEGLPAGVLLTPVCTNGLKYINMTDTCQ